MTALFLILSYFIGAFPTAYLVGKWVKGIDIRQHGSKNVGATNVFRCVGRNWGIVALLVDILKGFVAVTLWKLFDPNLSTLFLFCCGCVAVLGHNWTVFLKFKGGKGAATTLGMLLGLFLAPILCSLVIVIFAIVTTRYVSVGSMLGAATFPIFFSVFERGRDDFWLFMAIIIPMALLILFKHKKNIERLLKGEENKIPK